MLKSINLSNFKLFSSLTQFELTPITILLGENASGKSSLIQSLLLLKQTLESRFSTNPLLLKGDLFDFGNYEDLIHLHETSSGLQYSLSFGEVQIGHIHYSKRKRRGIDRVVRRNVKTIIYNASIDIRFKLNKTSKIIFVDFIKIYDTENTFSLSLEKAKTTSSYKLRTNIDTKYLRVNYSKYITLTFNRFWPDEFEILDVFYPEDFQDTKKRNINSFLSEIISEVNYVLLKSFKEIAYIGPLREHPRSYYEFSGEIPNNVGTKGENTFTFMSLRSKSRRLILLLENSINKWLKALGFNASISIITIEKGYLYKVVVNNLWSEIQNNITHYGFGLSQFLPILVQTLAPEGGPLILIEQPELHLNPKIQSEIADLFIQASKKKQFVIETHSEHLITRLQRRVAEGIIGKDKISIYYFEKGSSGIEVRNIRMNHYGEIPQWPKHFFDEEYRERLKQVEAISKAKKNERNNS